MIAQLFFPLQSSSPAVVESTSHDLSVLGATVLEHGVWSFMQLSVISGVVVFLAILLHYLLRRVVAPGWLYLLWVLVLIRFVVIAVPASPTSFLNLLVVERTSEQVTMDFRPLAEPAAVEQEYIFADSTIPFVSSSDARALSGTRVRRESKPEYEYESVVARVLTIVWAVVFLCLLLRLAVCVARVIGLVRRSQPPPSALAIQFEKIRQRVCSRQRVGLRVTSEIEVPAMTGWFRPVVLIPDWCIDELDDRQKDCVFTHELVHVRRRDNLIQLFAQLVAAFHWFNPLARIACRFIDSMRELSCDRATLAALEDGANEQTRRLYGQTILQIAGRPLEKSRSGLLFARGFTGSERKLIKQRISMLVSPVSSSRTIHAIAGALSLSLVVAVGFTTAQTVENEPVNVEVPAVEAVSGSGEIQPATVEVGFAPDLALARAQQISLNKGEVTVVTADAAVSEIVISDPAVVSVNAVAADKVMITAISRGRTDVRLQKENGDVRAIEVTVAGSGVMQLTVGQTQRMTFDFNVPEIRIHNPEVLDVKPVKADEVLITALTPGTTMIDISDAERNFLSFAVQVAADTALLQSQVKEQFPDSDPDVAGRHDSIVLSGKAEAAEIDAIVRFVADRTELPVVNQMISSNHLAIKVELFEVDTDRLQELGVDWQEAPEAPGQIEIESIADFYRDDSVEANNVTIATSGEGDQIEELMGFLCQNSLATLVSRPVLVCKYDQTAQFMTGAEIPIVVKTESGEDEVHFRPVGTILDLTPKESEHGMILEFGVELSKIDRRLATADGQPGFQVRRVNAGVSLEDSEQLVLVVKNWAMSEEEESSREVVLILTPSELPVSWADNSDDNSEARAEATPVELPAGVYPQPVDLRR